MSYFYCAPCTYLCGAELASVQSKRSLAGGLLVAELKGKVTKDDYTARSFFALDSLRLAEPVREFDASKFIDLACAYQILDNVIESSSLSSSGHLEGGFVKRKDGCWYVAVSTDLGKKCNGKMVDWWFSHCDDTVRYTYWHPRDHISCFWDPQYFAVQGVDRKPGHYIGHVHHVTEKIAGKTQELLIEFESPLKYFESGKLLSAGVTACICAKVMVDDPIAGLISVGRLMHIVFERNGKCVMKSRFWLGEVTALDPDRSLLPISIINRIGNSRIYRTLRLSSRMIKGLWMHCAEEMFCLKSFLPDYYEDCLAKYAILPPGHQCSNPLPWIRKKR